MPPEKEKKNAGQDGGVNAENTEKQDNEIKDENTAAQNEVPEADSSKNAQKPKNSKDAKKDKSAAKEQAKSEADKLREENAALSDRLLRNMAEFDNYRKRSAKERDSIYPDAVANTVAKLLTVADSLERALSAPCADEEYKKGIEKIYTAFIDGIGKLGVSEIRSAGEKFDPTLHNAVMHIEDESLGESVITDVFQKGYIMGDKVVRHAMVKVAN